MSESTDPERAPREPAGEPVSESSAGATTVGQAAGSAERTITVRMPDAAGLRGIGLASLTTAGVAVGAVLVSAVLFMLSGAASAASEGPNSARSRPRLSPPVPRRGHCSHSRSFGAWPCNALLRREAPATHPQPSSSNEPPARFGVRRSSTASSPKG